MAYPRHGRARIAGHESDARPTCAETDRWAPLEMVRALAASLESREAPVYFNGLLVTVMLSCGLWADGLDLTEPLR